jgi:purine-nucleoside phosphorylase
MGEFFTKEQFSEAADFVRARCTHEPTVGLILGSGLGPLAEEVDGLTPAIPYRAQAGGPIFIPYADIPHFPTTDVAGHAGRLVIGKLAGRTVAVMQGRVHYYEGYSMQEVILPVRVMQLLGVRTLIVTNAAGGLNPQFSAGDLMLITDHLSLIAMTGLNPLRGPNVDEFGPRFPDMTSAYDPDLRRAALQVAAGLEIPLQQGVYVCLSGPSFETRADLKFLRAVGADAVGMSTVPEVIVARHGGMRVLGISGISNIAADLPGAAEEVSHEDVLRLGQAMAPRLMALIKGVLRLLD